MKTLLKEREQTVSLAKAASAGVSSPVRYQEQLVDPIVEEVNPTYILPLIKDKRICYHHLLSDDKLLQLKNFSTFYKENPSVLNWSFLNSALHEYLALRDFNPEMLREIVLNTFDEQDTIGAFVFIYKHSNLQPPVHAYVVEAKWRYFREPTPTFLGAVGNDALSSLEIYRLNNRKYFVYLFEHDQYQGRYINFYGDAHEVVNYVGNDFNDITSSLLIVSQGRRDKSLPVALFKTAIKRVITDALEGSREASIDGDVKIGWTMWPGWAPSQTFIRIEQPIEITVDLDDIISFPSDWFGIDLPDYPSKYKANIVYYIEVKVVNGALSGRVAFYNAVVESGILHNSIREKLMPKVAANIPTINMFLAENLKGFKDLRDVYLLPGNSLTDGHTDDGVIVRLVPN